MLGKAFTVSTETGDVRTRTVLHEASRLGDTYNLFWTNQSMNLVRSGGHLCTNTQWLASSKRHVTSRGAVVLWWIRSNGNTRFEPLVTNYKWLASGPGKKESCSIVTFYACLWECMWHVQKSARRRFESLSCFAVATFEWQWCWKALL